MELQKLNVVNLSKKELAQEAEMLILGEIEKGNFDLNDLSKLSKIHFVIGEILSKAKDSDYIQDRIFQAGKDNTYFGVKFEFGTTAKYDYSNSPAWNYYQSQIDALAESRKKVETIAKATTTVTKYVTEHGEELDVFPAEKTESKTVKTTIK